MANADLERVFAAQAKTMLRLRRSTAKQRLAGIDRLYDAVFQRVDRIYEAFGKDFRKPPPEVDAGELLPFGVEVKQARRHLAEWMKPQPVAGTPLMLGTSGWVRFQPRGRCLILAPWNYPLNLTLGPLVSCIAAGNTAVVKPSEMTPHVTEVMRQIVSEVFPEDEVALIPGDGATATALLELPFDHIFLTGSPAVGKIVMAAAAKHLTSVTLELGGKSPAIIDKSANLDAAAQTLMWGKFTNNGQTCIAPDFVLVQRTVHERFLELCADVLKSRYGATAELQFACVDLARMVNAQHTRRVAELLDDAVMRGARVVFGGAVREEERYVAPTLLTGVAAGSRVLEEEIFGPLLPVIAFDELDEAIARVNDAPKPLALYIWSGRELAIREISERTSSGGVCINGAVVQFVHGNLPFGGVNGSGMGNAHGFYGFRAFSHERAFLRVRVSLAGVFFPPYRGLKRRLVNWLSRF